MDASQDPKAGTGAKTGKPFKVCQDCYEVLEHYKAELRTVLPTARLFTEEEFAAQVPKAPELCHRCRVAMDELKEIRIAAEQHPNFRFGV